MGHATDTSLLKMPNPVADLHAMPFFQSQHTAEHTKVQREYQARSLKKTVSGRVLLRPVPFRRRA